MMSTNEFTYRSASIKDKAELQELAIAAYSPFSALMTAENANKLISGLKDEEKMISLINRSKCFACIDQGKIIGMAFIIPHGNPWQVFKAEWSYIRMVAVHPDYRGRGIAKKLTHMCITFAKDTHETIIALHTSEFMDDARHIYENLGFKQLKEIEPIFGKRYWLYQLDLKTNEA
jgi:ribosomal protein S18 acetylase RimI-like enzyme